MSGGILEILGFDLHSFDILFCNIIRVFCAAHLKSPISSYITASQDGFLYTSGRCGFGGLF